ncbi:hypothetical protein IAG41_04070 [Sphingomonas sp. JC676]|uniref:hypothetical protein n=1 Tax=Sphingomonas sp. JC676 TaxID=2768065 RepID=UPI0016578EA9|nr:hypothetical protein [Sphingomonas sp. JC676]MBC9031561.1 hypothetical protein [Sphingomonas sp. JC676]
MTMSTSFNALLVGACLVLGAPAAQAQQTGHIIVDHAAEASTRDVSAADQARDTMNRYGVCVVKVKSVAVKRALSQPTDQAIDSALAKIAIDECLGSGELTMSRSLFRGAVYRALYIRDFGQVSQAPATIGMQGKDAAAEAAATTPMNLLQRFGDCVVRADPADAQALVLATAATQAERSAITRLGPSLGGCVAPTNQVRFSRAVLQGVLAEALYKRAAASEPSRVK